MVRKRFTLWLSGVTRLSPRAAEERVDYALWRLVHPLRSFADYYVQFERGRLARGVVHPTLGQQEPAAGREEFAALVRAGLKPVHRTVDFGCGSLRVGRHLIEYLDPGHYWGLDITTAFYEHAVADIDAALLAEKRPNLARFSPDVFRRVQATQPDVIMVLGVLQCVPPVALGRLMHQVAGLAVEATQIVVSFLEAAESQQLGPLAFRHSWKDLARAARFAGLSAVLVRQGLEPHALQWDLPGVLIPTALKTRMRQRGLSREIVTALGMPELGHRRGSVALLTKQGGDGRGALSSTDVGTRTGA